MTNELDEEQQLEDTRGLVVPPRRMVLLFVLLALAVIVLVATGRMNLREVFSAPLDNSLLLWLSLAFLVNVFFQAGENEIVGPAGTDDYQVELEKYLVLELLTASAKSRHKVENLLFIKKTVFLHGGQLVRMSGWAFFFSFWTFLGLLILLLILNWQWTFILSLLALVLFYLPFFRKAGLVLAKPLFRPLRAGVDY
jgi:hypothetical protein